MQSDGAPRAIVRWSLGLVLLAGTALTLLLLHQPDRAGAAELPTLPEVVAVVDATAPGVLPPGVVEAGDPVLEPVLGAVDGAVGTVVDTTDPLLAPVLATVDPGGLPVVGELLDPTLPLPLPTPLPLPQPVPDVPGTGVTPRAPSTGGPAAGATSLLRADARPGAERATGVPFLVPDPTDIRTEAVMESERPTGGPVDAVVDLLAPLGTLTGASGGGAGAGLVLLAVLGAFAWELTRGQGQRLVALLARPADGAVIAFERPG